MTDSPPFLSLRAAAEELDLSTDEILLLAAQGKIVLCVPVPGDVAVWQRLDHALLAGSSWRTMLKPHFKLLSLDSDACNALRGEAELRLSPLFSGGLLKPPDEPWHKYTPPPLRLLKKSNSSLPKYPIREVNVADLPDASSWGGLRSLIAMREEKPFAIVASQSTVVVPRREISNYLDNLLPLPESVLITYPTTAQYLIELDDVARHMYALGILRKNHYPVATNILEAIRKKPSFARRETNIDIKNYKDIVETARVVITPSEITKRGKRLFCPDVGYVSPNLKAIIDVSYELHEHHKNGNRLILTNVSWVKERLRSGGMSPSLSERCPPLLIPR